MGNSNSHHPQSQHQITHVNEILYGPPGATNNYLVGTGTSPLLSRRTETNQSRGSERRGEDSNARCITTLLLLIRCSYLLALVAKLFLKFILIPWLFFHKKPYGDINNVSIETITIFLWLILIYMTIFVMIGIVGILDDNMYLTSCFLFLMDMEVIICLYNGYIDSSSPVTLIISGAVVMLTSVYLLLNLCEKRLIQNNLWVLQQESVVRYGANV